MMLLFLVVATVLATAFMACNRLLAFIRRWDWVDLWIAVVYGLCSVYGFYILWRADHGAVLAQ